MTIRHTSYLFLAICLLFLPFRALAGTVTFFDSTEILTFADNSGRASGSCSVGNNPYVAGTPFVEYCSVMLLAPAGATSGDFSSVVAFHFKDADGTNNLSDTFAGSNINNTAVVPPVAQIVFSSEVDGRPFGTCPSCIVEDGTVQTAFSITWTLAGGGEVVDTIMMQSDASEAPEPMTGLLAMPGLALLAVFSHRQRRPRSGNPAY